MISSMPGTVAPVPEKLQMLETMFELVQKRLDYIRAPDPCYSGALVALNARISSLSHVILKTSGDAQKLAIKSPGRTIRSGVDEANTVLAVALLSRNKYGMKFTNILYPSYSYTQ